MAIAVYWLRDRVEALRSPDMSANDLYRRLAGPAWCRGLDDDDVRDAIWTATGVRPTCAVGEPLPMVPDWRVQLQNRAELARQDCDLARFNRLKRAWRRLAKKETRHEVRRER